MKNNKSRMNEAPVHLHVHSEYSLLDGAIRLGDLLARAEELGHDSIALTDHGNLFGAVEFYLKAKSRGLRPIIGAEIFWRGTGAANHLTRPEDESNAGFSEPAAYHLVLLAKNLVGYKNLIKIVSSGYLEGLGVQPIVSDATLAQHADGLIALSACSMGEFGYLADGVSRLSKSDPRWRTALTKHVSIMRRRFPDSYYIELTDNNLPSQKRLLPVLAQLAKAFELPIVATGDAHYLNKSDADAHAVLLGIKHGMTMAKLRRRQKDARFHLLDNEEMLSIYEQWPDALANTRAISEQCNIEFKFGQYFLPNFSIDGDGKENADLTMKRMAHTMLEERFVNLRRVYGVNFDAAKEKVYRDRLDYEISIICKMGFPGYFLIVQDFINWAKKQGIPVGPGRGSGTGSLVAYALRITDLDPMPYNLIFERFLNPERVSLPDFDVDFCQDRRDEVIAYVTQKYGASNVAQITTFGKMNAKAVVRDVGRVLELGYGRVDRIAKLIPDELGITLEEALAKEPRLCEEATRDDKVGELLELAQKLEGLCRHTSVHAAGVVISDKPLIEHVPVYTTEEDGLITQYEMKMAEKVGLVKFDFLGLKTLTVIQKAVDFIRTKDKPDFDISMIPLSDRRVYDEIGRGHTVGMFQLESSGMRQLVTRLKPSCFEDIIALVALFRPGPLGSGMVDDFIECKHGRKEIKYPLPELAPILRETYGTILYQDQVMQIAKVLANYSLGEADLLRRAMGKKIASEMEKQKNRFLSGCEANDIDARKAIEIFDMMAEFAKYGFAKSHAAAYGLISYQTAYVKVHFPEHFMAAIMTCDLGDTKKIVRYVDECQRMKIKVLPPNVNRSALEFRVPEKNTIDFGLAAIKGIGESALKKLVEARIARGSFSNLSDLGRRVDLGGVGKKTLEILTLAGALDDFQIARPKLCELIPDVVKFSEDHHQAKATGQGSLFDHTIDNDDALGELSWSLAAVDRQPGAPNPCWLNKEKALLGVYLTNHPLNFHKMDLDAFSTVRLAQLDRMVGKKVMVIAVLANMNERITRKGARIAGIRLEDVGYAFEAVMFANDFPDEWPTLDSIVVASGSVDKSFDGASVRFRVEGLNLLEDVRSEHIRNALLTVNPGSATDVRALHRFLKSNAGDTPLKLKINYANADLIVDLKDHPVTLSNNFLYTLKQLPFSTPTIEFEKF